MKLHVATAGLLLAAAAVSPAAHAQRVLFRADPATDSMQVSYGPNRKFYQHLFVGYTPVVGNPAGSGAALRPFKSAELFIGVRSKFRLTQTISTGFDVQYVRLVYALEQNSRKQLPSPQLHEQESLVLSQVQVQPFVRLGFGRRGNVIGHYLDLSGWGGWAMATSHRTEDRPGTGGSTRMVVVEHGLSYLRRWPFGVGARLGAGRYAATARYRLSDTFIVGANPAYVELPRWLVGLELGLF